MERIRCGDGGVAGMEKEEVDKANPFLIRQCIFGCNNTIFFWMGGEEFLSGGRATAPGDQARRIRAAMRHPPEAERGICGN